MRRVFQSYRHGSLDVVDVPAPSVRLHLLLGTHLVFLPQGEPGRNPHVESFNDLWQERVLRHPCPDLRALRRTFRFVVQVAQAANI